MSHHVADEQANAVRGDDGAGDVAAGRVRLLLYGNRCCDQSGNNGAAREFFPNAPSTVADRHRLVRFPW
jgi:hypothetical protein